MDFVKQVISDFKIDLIVGSGIVLMGVIVPVFRLYWLIAGINTTPKEELKKMDLKYIGKYFGICMSVLGFLMILNPFVFSYFGLKQYIPFIQLITVFAVVGFMFVFGRIKKNRIYKQEIEKNK
jgi:hypothetical protein